MDEILLLPKIRKIQESMKKISSNTQTKSKSDSVKQKDKVSTVSNHVKVVENTIESSKKRPVEYDMGYDIVEDIKKTKADFYLFEFEIYLSKKRSFWRILIHNLVGPKKTFNPIKKLMKLALEGSLNLKLFHSCLFRFSITMSIIV